MGFTSTRLRLVEGIRHVEFAEQPEHLTLDIVIVFFALKSGV